MDTIYLIAFRNLWRNTRRTVLTMLAIAFGAALLIFSIGIQLGSYDGMIINSLRVYQGFFQIQRRGYLEEPKMRTTIPDALALANTLRTQTGIRKVSVRANGFGLVSSQTRSYGTQIVGVEPETEPLVSTIPGVITQGKWLSGAFANEAVIGASLAKNLKLALGDDLTILGSGKDGSIAATVLQVVGIFESGSIDLDRSIVEIPLKVFQEAFSMGNDAHAIIVSGDHLNELDAIFQNVTSVMSGKDDLVLLNWEELQPGLKEMIELDFSSGWLIYIVLVAVITFSILNTFLMSVLERTREFGIMLALGFKPFRIGQLVMLEALLLTVLGLLLGMIIGIGICYYYYVVGFTVPGMDEIAKQFNMPPYIYPQLSGYTFFMGPLVILISTLLAALYPAARIRVIKPVDAMRTI